MIGCDPGGLSTEALIGWFAQQGITVTPGEKTAGREEEADYFTFLGREARVKDGLCRMRLPKRRMEDMLNYGVPGLNPKSTLQAMVDAFSYEAYDYGKEQYDYYRAVIAEKGVGVEMMSFEEVRNKLYSPSSRTMMEYRIYYKQDPVSFGPHEFDNDLHQRYLERTGHDDWKKLEDFSTLPNKTGSMPQRFNNR